MVSQKELLDAVKQAKENSRDRKFKQSVDVIINLKQLGGDFTFEDMVNFPSELKKPKKVCAFVGAELKTEAKKHCDKVVTDLGPYQKDARKVRKLRKNYDFFIAQATIMPDVAKTFGRYFAPVGKMPNPKFGMVVPPKAKLGGLVKKLKHSAIIRAKKVPVVQGRVGSEEMEDKALAKNASALIDSVIKDLPQGKQNIKNVLVKTTMGKPVKIE